MKTSILTAAVTAIMSLAVATASAQTPTKKDTTMHQNKKTYPTKTDSTARYHRKDSVSTYKKNAMNPTTPKTSTK